MCQEYFEVNKNNMKNRIVLIQKSKTYVNIRIYQSKCNTCKEMIGYLLKIVWYASIEKTLNVQEISVMFYWNWVLLFVRK